MNWFQKLIQGISQVTKYRIRRIIIISLSWTAIDLFLYLRHVSGHYDFDYPYHEISLSACLLRSAIVFVISLIMSWLLLKEIRIAFVKRSLVTSFIIKVLLLLLVAVAAGITIFTLHFLIIKKMSLAEAIGEFRSYFFYTRLASDSLLFWMVMLLSALVIVEIDQKYSPGVFWEVLTGKYFKPRNEKRIIMFLDLKDSTPVSEQLGHEKYFLFIKDFIYWVSKAVLENEGMIYQYVGDEVVVTWPYRKLNILKSLNTVIESGNLFNRIPITFGGEYDGIVPDFRVGLHAGDVTIGEIGIMKKEIAISGEAMNIAARIRSTCNELNQKFVVSKDYFESGILKSWQGEDLGEVSLKGLDESMQLYALKI